LFLTPLDQVEPSDTTIIPWMENVYSKLSPVEQARWNQSHIDTMFYAGAQDFVNRQFNFSPGFSYNNYYFNLIQQPVNMLTGYQRQHRKSITYQASSFGDPKTTDQYTKLIMGEFQRNGVYNSYSKGCEHSAVTGMVLAQPYLDFCGEDNLHGEIKLKIWEYNSFMVDPFFRNPDMSDASVVWCQEFITKEEAEFKFPNSKDKIKPFVGSPQRYSRFYFLPENTNQSRNDLLVLNFLWYRSTRKKKKLFSRSKQIFFDFAEHGANVDAIISMLPDLEEVEVTVPTWKTAVVLNNSLMYHGLNPFGFDRCPFIPLYWNYDPQISNYNYRVRSLVRTMRDPQFLYNYKVITNNEVADAVINSGYQRKVGAVANEDNLKKRGGGYDILINEGYEMTDCQKIQPTAVPQSDLELATQMADLIYATSGINLENWSGQNDKQISALTAMLKQAANLMVFQKYFDNWDYALEQVGDISLQIILNMWSPEKVQMVLGEEPSPLFYSKIFSHYRTVVQEGIMTPTQQNMQAQQLLDINAAYGREVFPPSHVIKYMNIQGKDEAMQFLQQQEQQASEMQQHQQMMEQSVVEAQLKNLYAQATNEVAMARERHGRTESNIGLFEERLSEITHNRAMATRDKMEALEKLIDIIGKYGELQAAMGMGKIEQVDKQQQIDEDREKLDARRTALSNQFVQEIMSNPPLEGQEMQQAPEMQLNV